MVHRPGHLPVTSGVPDATIARLPGYLRALETLESRGVATTSSQDLANEAGTQPAQLRRDLSYFGNLGTRGVGYDVVGLREALGAYVGTSQTWPVLLVGAGQLGSALAQQFSHGQFQIVAAVDSNPALVGQRRGNTTVRPQAELGREAAQSGAVIGIIAVPAEAAQAVCDALVAARIRNILHFAPSVLRVPRSVVLRRVDLAQELQILAFHESQRRAKRVGRPRNPQNPRSI